MIPEGRNIGGYCAGIPTATQKRVPILTSIWSLLSAFTKYHYPVERMTADHEWIFYLLNPIQRETASI